MSVNTIGINGKSNDNGYGNGGNGKQGAIHGRESFMAGVASRLGRSQPLIEAPVNPHRGAPDFYKAIRLTTDEKIEMFERNWTALTGKLLVVEEAEAQEKVAAWLKAVAEELGVQRASRWEHDGLAALGLDEALAEAGVEVVPWRPLGEQGDELAAANAGAGEQPPASAAGGTRSVDAAAEPGPAVASAAAGGSDGSRWAQRSELLRRTERCELGVVWPDFAVAGTSSLVLQCSRERGRSVSLLTDVLFAVFRADQLVTRMGEAFTEVVAGAAGEPLRYPSSLNLITGPSRSADIENDLTIGIHGPGKVYAVIIK